MVIQPKNESILQAQVAQTLFSNHDPVFQYPDAPINTAKQIKVRSHEHYTEQDMTMVSQLEFGVSLCPVPHRTGGFYFLTNDLVSPCTYFGIFVASCYLLFLL